MITARMQKLVTLHPRIKRVNVHEITLAVSKKIMSGISTYALDEFAANICASFGVRNPQYLSLAARIAIDNHQKIASSTFTEKVKVAYNRVDNRGRRVPLINDKFYAFVIANPCLNDFIVQSRDHLLTFFGFRTFQRLYSLRVDNVIIETPQDMFLRAAIALSLFAVNQNTLANIRETYNLLSQKHYTQASPTYFNAGTRHEQFSSCFLLGSEDSLDGIMNTNTDLARISKWSGGIGLHIHTWRSRGAEIRGTNGTSDGIVPFLRITNNVMRAVNQGGRRTGSAAIYLMPHHPDIVSFLRLRSNDGVPEQRARDLFYALWVPDLFMCRLANDEVWHLFDPDEFGDLSLLTGEAYTAEYLRLEAAGKWTGSPTTAKAIWNLVVESNRQTGMPYICFADNANRQSQQQNLGVIRSSNLCAEIYQYSDYTETAVCNLCSINLGACVRDANSADADHEFPKQPYFDFEQLIDAVGVCVRNLNAVIDSNFYPTAKTERSNMRHRPIGIGVQGLADAFMKMRYPFESKEAQALNTEIFETMYFAALTKSSMMCREEWIAATRCCQTTGEYSAMAYFEDGSAYLVPYTSADDIPKKIGAYPSASWNGGSPISKGTFHWEFDALPDVPRRTLTAEPRVRLCGKYDWETLRLHIREFGVKNSLLIALMPTASTSQLLGNNECFEPFTSNIYKRRTLAGDFTVVNKYLIHDLVELGLWSDTIKDYLLELEGSVQAVDIIPAELRQLYKTAWEIDQTALIRLAADRQPFIDQGQSLNIHVENLDWKQFTQLMYLAWGLGLKTGKYYAHTRSAVSAIKFTISPEKQKKIAAKVLRADFMEPVGEECLVCSG
ncbi:ribonucleoside-diphosphate reductase subunit alpha [Candidatus Gracilibacteria bacterium]|nr:ribonucleoside-diphosphate reductase subunit alpha [Candidatus Gracilibacteria bacterium]